MIQGFSPTNNKKHWFSPAWVVYERQAPDGAQKKAAASFA